jgi:hypothetical protein
MTFLTATIAGGDENDIQYNKGGVLHGDDNLEWDPINKIMTVIGDLTFPFVKIHLKLIIDSGSIDSVTIFITGFGYKNGTYSVSVPGGQNGSIDVYITENAVSNVVVTNVGTDYIDGTLDFYPEIDKYGTITANKYTNNFVVIENDEISGVANLDVSDKITATNLTIDSVSITNNNITNLENITSNTITVSDLTVGNVSINDANGLTGLTNITCSGIATINDLDISGLTITSGNISGINNLSASGTISVGNSITSGNIIINSNSIVGVNDITTTGTLNVTTLNVNSNSAIINSLGDFTTTGEITVSNTLSSNTITDGILTINNGTISGANDLSVSGDITLEGNNATITIGSVVLSNNALTGLTSVTASGDVTVTEKIRVNSINSRIGSNLVLNSSGDTVTINQVAFQGGSVNVIDMNVASEGSIKFLGNTTQKIFSSSADISIESPNGLVSINGVSFDLLGNITSVNDFNTAGTITANRFDIGDIVIENNTITGIVDLETTDLTTSGTLTITGTNPSIDSDNKITITSGSNPTIISGVTFQEGNITTVGNVVASEIVAGGTIHMTSLAPVITAVDDITISSTGGFVNIGGLTINNGRLTNVKSLRTTTDITIGGDLSLNGTLSMNANIIVVSEVVTESNLTGENGFFINGTYINAVGGVTVTVVVSSNTAVIDSIVVAPGTPDSTVIVPIEMPLLGRIISPYPIVIESANGITIDTTTISATGDVVANSLQSSTIKTGTISSNNPVLVIDNPSGDISIAGVVITNSNDILNVSDLSLTGIISSQSVTCDTFTSTSGTFDNLNVSKIVTDDFTIGNVVFDNSSISNVSGITCSGSVVTGNLDILGTLNVSNINTSQIGGVTFDNKTITADDITTTGNISANNLTLTGGSKTITVSEILGVTKIAGIVFEGTNISGLTNITSSGTITANKLKLNGSISADVISNPIGTVTIENIDITDGDMTNVTNITMTGDLTAVNIHTDTLSSINNDLIINTSSSENVPVRLISTVNVIVPLFVSGDSTGLTLTVDGIDAWTIGDKFVLTAQTLDTENDVYEIVAAVDPIVIQRVYFSQSLFSKAYTSSEGTTNTGKTFIVINTFNNSVSGTDTLTFEESIVTTLSVGGVSIRENTIDAASVVSDLLKIGNIEVKHNGTEKYSLTLPDSLGTVGEVLVLGAAGQLSWASPDAYTLGGVEGSVQINTGSDFGGSADLIWDDITGLTISSGNDLFVGDLKFSHDSTDAFITNQTGDLIIESENLILKSTTGNFSFKNGSDQEVVVIDQSGNMTIGTSLDVGPINISDGNITGVVYTTDGNSLVSKEYVDKLALGIKWVEPVLVATLDNIDIDNPPALINGIALSLNIRVLLLGQTNPVNNGIYFFDLASNLTRPLSGEFSTGYPGSGTSINVTYLKETWLCTNAPGQDTIGTHSLTFIKLVSGGITTGKGISMTGNTIFINADTDEFEFNEFSQLAIKKIPIDKLTENTITVTGQTGVIVSNSNPKLGESFDISLDRSIIMDLHSDQTVAGFKTFTNGMSVSNLIVNADLNLPSGTITANSFIAGNVSITDNSVFGVNELNIGGVISVTGSTKTGSLTADSITSVQEIVISSNEGITVEGVHFDKNVITGVDILELNDNIVVGNIVKQTGDIVILSGSGSYTIINGVKIKDNILYDIKGIEGLDSPTLFNDTTGTITIGGPDVEYVQLLASDGVILGTSSGTVTVADLVVGNNANVQGSVTTSSLDFTSGQTQTINKPVGALVLSGDSVSIDNVIFENNNITGINDLTSTSISTSGNTTVTGNMNIAGNIYSSTDLSIVSDTGIVNIGPISFDNGVISGAGDLRTNNVSASNTVLPSSIFTDSTTINIGGENTTEINIESSDFNVTGNATVFSDTVVTGDLNVTGDVTVTGDILFNNGTITKILGDLSLTAPLIDINGVKIDTGGNLDLNSISVSGEVNVSGGVYISQSLTHGTLTIGDGSIGSTTTVEGNVFTNGTISTGTVQLNEIQASTGSEMKILTNNNKITIGGPLTESITVQSDTVNMNGTINVNVVDIIASNVINVDGSISVSNDIIFTGNTTNRITNSGVSDFHIGSDNLIIINNAITIDSDSLTSTVPVSCISLETDEVKNVNKISSSTGITFDSPTISFGNVIFNSATDTVTGISSLGTETINANNVTANAINSSGSLSLESNSGSIVINGTISIDKAGGLTGISSLLTNSLQSSNITSSVDVYTQSTGIINFGSSADTINFGSDSTIVNIGNKNNTIVKIGNASSGSVTINAEKTTVLGDIISSGNLILQGNDATITSGNSGQLTLQTGNDGILDLNGFRFYTNEGKAVIDYIGTDASNISLFNTTPGNVTIGGELAETISLDSKNLLDISSDEINIIAENNINIGSTGNVNIESGKEGINIVASNVAISSNLTVSGDVFISGNIEFTDANVFNGFSSIQYDNDSIVNASNMIVSGTLDTNNLIVNNISSNADTVVIFSDKNLEIGGEKVIIGNKDSTVTIGSIEIVNDTIYTPERLKIQAHSIILGNPDDPESELIVNKKVSLNGGIAKVRSLKATHMSTNYLRCNRLKLPSDPTGFYDCKHVLSSFGPVGNVSVGNVEYTRMGNFVNISGKFDTIGAFNLLSIANCPRSKRPTVLRVGFFPSLISTVSQMTLVDTETYNQLVVRVYDSTTNEYRNLVSADFILPVTGSFTFSGTYTTDIYEL